MFALICVRTSRNFVQDLSRVKDNEVETLLETLNEFQKQTGGFAKASGNLFLNTSVQ